METSQKLRVFISYARSDASGFADELLAGLEAAGFDPFLDRHDIAPGEDWETRLNNLLQQADTVVYALTPAWVASPRCRWEVDRAEALHKRLIPVVAIDVPEADTPANLRKLNYIYFSPGHSFGAGLRDLSTALRTDLSWIREHTRLGELAVRWRAQNNAESLQLRGSELEAAKVWLQNWKSPAPEPTDLHRALINESDTAETQRNSAERKRLDEVAQIQTEKARALKSSARMTALLGGVVAVALIATGVFAYAQYQQKQELDATRTDLAASRVELVDKQTKLEAALATADDLAAKLSANASALAPAPAISGGGAAAAQAQVAAQASENRAVQAQVRDFVRQARIALGWDIDVFYCEGAAANQSRAQAVLKILNDEEDRQQSGAGKSAQGLSFSLGRLRLRPLTAATNAREGYGLNSDAIRAEASENATSQALSAFIAKNSGPALTAQPSTQRTANYLSIFICGG